MEKKKIVVCSMNKAKNNAVKKVLGDYFEDFEVIPLETDSGVSATPIGDDEGLLGCRNRIENAKGQVGDADIYIAMEGILTPNSYGTYLCGWSMIFDVNRDKYFTGCSAKINIPQEILDNVTQDIRLSEVVAKMTGYTDEEVGFLGTNGMLTKGVYTRTDEFIDSLNCAISTGFKML